MIQTATVNKVIFNNPENGYTIASLNIKKQEITALMTAPFKLTPGTEIEIEGEMIMHPQYGRQLKATKVSLPNPTTEHGIKAYLSSGILTGIGPAMAERIITQFGEDSLAILDNEPERLLAVRGIAQKTLQKIISSWKKNREGAIMIGELFDMGLTITQAAKAYKAYGSQATHVVQENPYRLAEDIAGIGFLKADEIASKVGFEKDHPYRITSGILFTLKQALAEGHCYLPTRQLVANAVGILDINQEKVSQSTRTAIDSQRIIQKKLAINDELTEASYLPPTYYAERYVEKRLRELASMPRDNRRPKAAPALTEEQGAAVSNALNCRLSAITGPAGSGKTFALREIIRNLEQREISYALAAPTGKASKRISEVTGRPASTIHRLLGFGNAPDKKKGEDNPLEQECVIIDEASMVDIFLMADLLKAMPRDRSLCLLGDASQLPPVGAGLVFRDLIASATCPVATLTKIHRQSERSNIISIANDINNGITPSIPNHKDTYMFVIKEPETAAQKVVELVTRKIPEKFGIPLHNIMTITPMKKGPLGTINLNRLIQQAIQPPDAPSLKNYKVGDRVMQTVNDYDKGVFNGEIGSVASIDPDTGTLTVAFEDILCEIEYSYIELDNLTAAFSTTIHKSQGSESQCVVLCLHSHAGHYIMLKRDLLYTAVTRARKLLVIVGDKKALYCATQNNATKARHTGLFKNKA